MPYFSERGIGGLGHDSYAQGDKEFEQARRMEMEVEATTCPLGASVAAQTMEVTLPTEDPTRRALMDAFNTPPARTL